MPVLHEAPWNGPELLKEAMIDTVVKEYERWVDRVFAAQREIDTQNLWEDRESLRGTG